MIVAIIPARGGSKRIPRKNIKNFAGKPMIAWPIAAARESGVFDRIVVSTDDPEIAAVARQSGAEAPFVRPVELSNDHVGTTAVIRHAIEWLDARGPPVDFACCIYATAPFVQAADLRLGLTLLRDSDAAYVFSVTSFASPIQRAIRINAAGRVEMFHPEYFNIRSQDLEEAYHDAGQFYWGRARSFVDDVRIFSIQSLPLVLPRYQVQDIDTPDDWKRAELMFQAWNACRG